MSKPNLRITIRGTTGSGKSAVAWAVKSVLKSFGIDTTISGDEDEPPLELERTWQGRLAHVSGRTVDIVTERARVDTFEVSDTKREALKQIRDMVGGESEDPDRDIARMQDIAAAELDREAPAKPATSVVNSRGEAEAALGAIMQAVWEVFCGDSHALPDCFKRGTECGLITAEFPNSTFVSNIVDQLAERGHIIVSKEALAARERLYCIAEEHAEVVQAVCKTLRHGYESTDPTKPDSPTNRQMLERELGDAAGVGFLACVNGDLDINAVEDASVEKLKRMSKYMHFPHAFPVYETPEQPVNPEQPE